MLYLGHTRAPGSVYMDQNRDLNWTVRNWLEGGGGGGGGGREFCLD